MTPASCSTGLTGSIGRRRQRTTRPSAAMRRLVSVARRGAERPCARLYAKIPSATIAAAMTTSVHSGRGVASCTSMRLLRQRPEILVHAGAIFHGRPVGAARSQPILRGLLDYALREFRLEPLEAERQLPVQRLPFREVLLECLCAWRRADHPLAFGCRAVSIRCRPQLPDAIVRVARAPQFFEVSLSQRANLSSTLTSGPVGSLS